jgi:DNA-binding HxlR family transcriptional regulator
MTGRRKYDQGCAVAHGLDLVGERWALLVVRDLLLGPKRFVDLREGLPGASPDVLTQRLRELQEAGVIRRRKLPPPAGAWVYELTEWGAQLEPVVVELARWSSRSPSMPHDAPIGVDSLVLALRQLFDADAAADLRHRVGLRLNGQDFTADIADGRLTVSRAPAEPVDATLDADTSTLAALLWKRRSLGAAVRSGDATTTGSRAVLDRFLRLFPRPTPTAADTEATPESRRTRAER